ncbi:unnamed protein product [Ectocarpus sp. 4 AP-2014]
MSAAQDAGPMVYGDMQLLRKVETGNMRGVETMLAAGAEPDGRPELNTRPLMVAAGLGKVSFVEFLVARGAGLNSRTCRDVPRPEGGIRLRTGSQAIHAAVYGGSPDVVYVLLQLGATPNATDDDGETPLIIACGDPTKDRFGFALASILLNGGADPSLSTRFGRTALSHAARSGHTDVIDLLLRVAPSRLDQADKCGVSPLCCAVQGGHDNSVSRLLSGGAASLRFAMELAVRFDQARILKMLLRRYMRERPTGGSVLATSLKFSCHTAREIRKKRLQSGACCSGQQLSVLDRWPGRPSGLVPPLQLKPVEPHTSRWAYVCSSQRLPMFSWRVLSGNSLLMSDHEEFSWHHTNIFSRYANKGEGAIAWAPTT